MKATSRGAATSIPGVEYQALFYASRDAIMTLDPPSWKFTSGNPAAVAMFGAKDEQELLSYEPWNVSPERQPDGEKSIDKAKQMIAIAMREGSNFFEWTHKRISGEIFYADVLLSKVEVGTRSFLHVLVRDITARKKIENVNISESKKTTEALRLSEEKYRTLINHLNDGVFIIVDGTVRFINEAFATIAGYTTDEILGRPFLDFIGPAYKEIVKKRYYLRQQGVTLPNNYEIQIIRKDGTLLDATLNVGIITFEGKTASMGVLRDISERKKAERALRENEQFLRQIVDLVPHFIFAKDKKSRFILVNKAVADAYGTNTSDIVGKSDIDFSATPEQARHFHEDDLAVIKRGKPKFIKEEPIKDSKGNTRYLQTTKIPFQFGVTQESGILGVSVDITEHKELREKILEDKSKDEAILESIGDAVFACDRKGKIFLFNSMAEQLSGVSAQDAIGRPYKNVLTFLKEGDEKSSEDFIARAMNMNQITKMTNHTLLLKKDGSKMPISDSTAPIKNVSGDVIGCVVVFHDVTREREIDKAKTEFVSLASHQLRTPLTTINWFCEALMSEHIGSLTAKQQEYLKEVFKASKRMMNLIDALLNVSRLELGTFAINPELLNIQDLVTACIKELFPLITTKRITLHTTFDPAIPSVRADRKLLGIVCTNLLSNAVKYSPEGATVDVTVQKKNSDVLIVVKDNGIGIPKSQQHKIFTKLFRTENAKAFDPDGTGLGLYIAYSIMMNSGGNIWFESHGEQATATEGSGSTFYVSLPVTGMNKKSGSKELI